MEINWTLSALRDLDLEMEYLETKRDVSTAKEAYSLIKNTINNLKEFPALGREGRIFGTRELVIKKYSYIIPYRVKNGNIEILALFHAKRKFNN